MHWVLQDNFYNEPGYVKMVETLERFNIPHSIHKVVPFVGELIPDISPDGPVVVMGSYSMRHVAERKKWSPGVFSMEHAQFEEQMKHWGDHLLNADAKVTAFKDAQIDGIQFIRPLQDSKFFAGTLIDQEQFEEWRKKVVDLGEDDGTSLRGDTLVMVASPKKILREYRFWIVNGRVVTGSLYKMGSRVVYSSEVERSALTFATAMAGTPMSVDYWRPADAFVLDICMIDELDRWDNNIYKIVEAQCINASGFYAGDVQKIVMAIESLHH